MFCQFVKIVESVFLTTRQGKSLVFGLIGVPFLIEFWKVFQDPSWGRIRDTSSAPEARKAGSEHGGGLPSCNSGSRPPLGPSPPGNGKMFPNWKEGFPNGKVFLKVGNEGG